MRGADVVSENRSEFVALIAKHKDEVERLYTSYTKALEIINNQRVRVDELKQALRDVMDATTDDQRPSDTNPHPLRLCRVCGYGNASHSGLCIVGRAQQLLNKRTYEQ